MQLSCAVAVPAALPAARDCVFGDWSDWSECSQETGEGFSKRIRSLEPATGDGKAGAAGPFASSSVELLLKLSGGLQWHHRRAPGLPDQAAGGAGRGARTARQQPP